MIYRHWDTIKTVLLQGWEWTRGLVTKFWEAGGDIVTGMVEGIKAKMTAARDTIVNFGNNIKGWFTSVLDMHSPSRVFMGYGANISEGTAIGITKAAGGVRSAVEKMVQLPDARALSFAAGHGGGAGGAITVHYAPTLNVTGQSGDREGIRRVLRDNLAELEAMLLRVSQQRERRRY